MSGKESGTVYLLHFFAAVQTRAALHRLDQRSHRETGPARIRQRRALGRGDHVTRHRVGMRAHMGRRPRFGAPAQAPERREDTLPCVRR